MAGVAALVSRERRLGGPLFPRAGRVAKEMTACSAAPRRAAPAGRGLERGRFRFRSLTTPVPLPPPGRPRAFHRHPASAPRRARVCHARPRGSGSSAGSGRAPFACPRGRRPAAAMGAYLSQPNTVKCSGDGVGAPRLPLPYGFSAMQGWRVSMEVRRQGPIGWPLHGGNQTEKGSRGDGVLLGKGSPVESLRPRQFGER